MAAIKVEGLLELDKKLKELIDEFGIRKGKQALKNSATQAMLPVVQAAKATVPVGTVPHKTHKGRLVAPGFTSRNIRRKTVITKDGKVKAMVGVAPEAFYSLAFIERGTSKITARPWLVPAFETSKERVLARFRERLRANIERIRKKGK